MIRFAGETARRGYAICATPRSGSNYLARLLTSTGALGRPLEYFDRASVKRSGWTEWPADPAQQLALIPDTASPNGVYGLKVFPEHFEACPTWSVDLPGLKTFVWLRRRDIIGQAISLVRARQTQVWHADDQPEGEPAFDATAIDAAAEEILAGDSRWRSWFARQDLVPLIVDYEDLGAGAQTIEAICQRLRVPRVMPDHELVDVRRQRDETTATWRRAYYLHANADMERF